MLRRLKNTYCFARALGVIFTLLSLLFVSSAQGSFEECAESVSQNIELDLSRRDPRKNEDHDCSSERASVALSIRTQPQSAQRLLYVAQTERSRMNGLGAFLLI